MPWKPGEGRDRRALETPFEDVPPHLRQPLWGWIQAVMEYNPLEDRYADVAVAMRIPLQGGGNPRQVFLRLCNEDAGFMLDLVETLLERYGFNLGGIAGVSRLSALLETANSAYRIRDDRRGLEERVVPKVKELASETARTATGSAGEHLAAAWNEAYGRKSNPVMSYSESVKAVEAAFAPVVSPQNPKQTLGTMIADIGQKPSKWRFVIASSDPSGVDTVLTMMRLLWSGQTSRHGGTGPTRQETVEEARAAVLLAATLVQIGVSGAFSVEPENASSEA